MHLLLGCSAAVPAFISTHVGPVFALYSDPNEFIAPLVTHLYICLHEPNCEPPAHAPYLFMLLSRNFIKETTSLGLNKATCWKVGKSIPALGFYKTHLEFHLS